MTSPTDASSPLADAFAEAKHRFPLWFSVWIGLGHVLTGTLLLTPPRSAAVATVLLPLAWVVAYYASLMPGRRPTRNTLLILILTVPVLAFAWWLPVLISYDGANLASLRFGYEILSPIWAAALFAHCYRDQGWLGVVVFFGLGAVYGFNLENSGIELGYFSEENYHFYVPFSRTPVSCVAGWCTIFYPSVYIANGVVARLKPKSRVLIPALLVSAAALSTDLHSDPIATALGLWVWNPQLEPIWFGVPLVNFTSWFAAVFAAAAAYYWMDSRTWTPRARMVVPVLSIPVALMLSAVINFAVVGLLEGVDGPSWTIFLDAMRARFG